MKTLKHLFTICLLIVGGQVFAQNTGLKPYENSTHTYSITKGTVGTSTVAWTISSGNQGTDWNIVSGAGTKDIEIQWLKAATYKLQVTETRTDYAGGCPTVREIEVIVGSNEFDVYADIVTAKNACATIDPSVVVDVDADGLNSNDVFGTTSREFLITADNAIGDWKYTYTLTHGGEAIGNLKVDGVAYDATYASGKTISVAAGTLTQTITVTYTTNNNRQDLDFDLALTITGATDSLGTTDGDATAGKTDDATYTVYAMPATTGITTDK